MVTDNRPSARNPGAAFHVGSSRLLDIRNLVRIFLVWNSSHGDMAAGKASSNSRSDGEEYLGNTRHHQPQPLVRSSENSIKVPQCGAKEERKEGYESRLIELMKAEGTMRVRCEDPGNSETKLGYVSSSREQSDRLAKVKWTHV